MEEKLLEVEAQADGTFTVHASYDIEPIRGVPTRELADQILSALIEMEQKGVELAQADW